MRILAGEFRSRRLLAPASDATRPVTDRVKQSLFDILAPRLDGTRVYDCFAGTGSMGLECLSRGAAHATFFEADRSAAALLRRNIADLGVQRRSTVVDRDLFRWFDTTPPPAPPPAQPPAPAQPPGPPQWGREAGRAEIIFLDPPDRFLTERPDDLRRLAARMAAHLAPGGVVVFRHDAKDALDLPALREVDRRAYGGMVIQLLSAAAPRAAEDASS